VPSRDVLDKLFEVEHRSEALVREASAEALRRASEAKEAAEIAFKSAYEEAVRVAEEGRKRADADADAEYAASIAAYRARLEGAALDEAAFKEECERYLAGIS
jgi:vacuolar-type H+-ATPase subunit H